MELALTIVVYGGPVLLGLMGLVVTEWPPRSPRGRIVWYSAFIIVAAGSVIAAVIDSKIRDARLEEMLIGGDNYGYLWAEVDSVENVTDGAPLWLKATGILYGLNIWIQPFGVTDPDNPRYYAYGGMHIPETRGGVRIGKTLPAGKYRVDLYARNGLVHQVLEIKNVGGKLVQNIRVFRAGEGQIYAEGPDVSR